MRRLTDRYGLAEFDVLPESEIVIVPDGEIRASGIGLLRFGARTPTSAWG